MEVHREAGIMQYDEDFELPWHVEDTRVPETAIADPTVAAFEGYLSAATFLSLSCARAALAGLPYEGHLLLVEWT
jgi:hypothetical protein